MTSKPIFSAMLSVVFSATVLASVVALPAGALAQQADTPKPAAKPAAKPTAKPAAKPAPKAAAKPAAAQPEAAKPAAKTEAAKPPAMGGVQPTLLGQYGDWGAYTASPGGKKLCFAIAKPTATLPAGTKRDPSYMFISTRPAEKVKDEVSLIMGYAAKPNTEAMVEIGTTTYAMYTQKDGAWIKNSAEEAKMVGALRTGSDVVIKGESGRGTKTTDTYSLKGLAQALDRAAQECK